MLARHFLARHLIQAVEAQIPIAFTQWGYVMSTGASRLRFSHLVLGRIDLRNDHERYVGQLECGKLAFAPTWHPFGSIAEHQLFSTLPRGAGVLSAHRIEYLNQTYFICRG